MTPRLTSGSRLGALVMACLVLGLALATLPGRGAAQSMFAAEVYVNDSAITRYEIDQRALFFQALGSGGADPRATARERLIDERVQAAEARRLGVRTTREQLDAALTEFAARAQLDGATFLQQMNEAGVETASVMDFLRAGIAWRELVNARFAPDIRITLSAVERAQTPESVVPVTEVLISEIFLPSDPQFAEAVAEIIPQILALTTLEQFSDAARQVSGAPSAPQGGRVDRWLQLAILPPAVAEAFRTSAVGTIAGPIEVPGAYGIFQLRARRETRDVPANRVELSFRRADLPGGRSEANLAAVEELRRAADSCSDFEAVLARQIPGLSSEALALQTRLQTEVASAIGGELARLNPREVSANLVDQGALVVLMLCNRRVLTDPAAPEAQIRLDLFNQALESRALVYLRTLRAEADIRQP